jgi:hypothetical protein
MSAMNSPTVANPEKVKADSHGSRKQVFNLSGQQYPFAFTPL